jgi:ABC-2 type transport system permease protein
MSAATQSMVLTKRAIREALRTPEALIPTLFIPLFFLIVNTGQASRIFKDAPFLKGQGYAAFQLPSSLLLAASFGSAALFLVEEIEGGYFDKLRATPASRTALVLGRLGAEFTKCLAITLTLILIALVMGIRIASGPIGWLLMLLMTAGWGVVYVGFMQLIALKTRSAAATNSGGLVFFPLLFLTPGFVPRNSLAPLMEKAATLNPVTYIMEGLRSLILDDLAMAAVVRGFAVIVIAGLVMIALNVRMIRNYD